jgi:hypothetical protein
MRPFTIQHLQKTKEKHTERQRKKDEERQQERKQTERADIAINSAGTQMFEVFCHSRICK